MISLNRIFSFSNWMLKVLLIFYLFMIVLQSFLGSSPYAHIALFMNLDLVPLTSEKYSALERVVDFAGNNTLPIVYTSIDSFYISQRSLLAIYSFGITEHGFTNCFIKRVSRFDRSDELFD